MTRTRAKRQKRTSMESVRAKAKATAKKAARPEQKDFIGPVDLFETAKSFVRATRNIRLLRDNKSLNPFLISLGPAGMLSDYFYSDRIIRRGLVNRMTPYSEPHYQAYGMASLAYQLACRMSTYPTRFSVTYGYISPEVSRDTVKWRNPSDPSYHRWDDGCAADFVVHSEVDRSAPKHYHTSPHALLVDAWNHFNEAESPLGDISVYPLVPITRAISYSESAGICLATDVRNPNRKPAAYLNVYEGVPKAKPRFVRLPRTFGHGHGVLQEVADTVQKHGWDGQGWPSHHQHGMRGVHHIHVTDTYLLSDVLKNPNVIVGGMHNRVPSNPDMLRLVKRNAEAFCGMLERVFCNFKVSIISGVGTDHDSISNMEPASVTEEFRDFIAAVRRGMIEHKVGPDSWVKPANPDNTFAAMIALNPISDDQYYHPDEFQDQVSRSARRITADDRIGGIVVKQAIAYRMVGANGSILTSGGRSVEAASPVLVFLLMHRKGL